MTARAAKLVPITVAADRLSVSVPTLRRWLRDGAPQAAQGRRGHGGRALVDVSAIAAWRRGQAGAPANSSDEMRLLAAEIPVLVELAVLSVFTDIEGPHKRACGDVLAGTWLACTVAIRDRLAKYVPDLQEIDALPPKIERLRRL